MWKCICDCQLELPETERQYTYVTTNSLTTGNTNSCGCYHREKLIEELHKRKTENKYRKYNGYYIGYTSKNEKFYVSEEDFDLIKDYKWFIDANGYVVTHDANDSFIYMHRLILASISISAKLLSGRTTEPIVKCFELNFKCVT